MNSTKCEKKHLSISNICNIIKSCRKSGVLFFKFGELELSFEKNYTSTSPEQKICERNNTKILEKEENETLFQKEADLKETQLAEMLINDPVQYEKLIEQGDVKDARSNDNIEAE